MSSLSFPTSFTNSANTAYQAVADAGIQSITWLKESTSTIGEGACKLARLAKDFFVKFFNQTYTLSKSYMAVALGVAKANPLPTGIGIGALLAVAFMVLTGKCRTEQKN